MKNEEFEQLKKQKVQELYIEYNNLLKTTTNIFDRLEINREFRRRVIEVMRQKKQRRFSKLVVRIKLIFGVIIFHFWRITKIGDSIPKSIDWKKVKQIWMDGEVKEEDDVLYVE